MTTQNYSLRIAIITMMCGLFLTGCGGGGGGDGGNTNSSNTQTINGIAVPPLPEPTRNNSTLAGIDTNNNGVRDDVERYIATKFGDNKTKFDVIMVHASTEQAALISKEQKKIDAHVNSLACLGSLVKEASEVTKVALNTPERKKAYGDTFASVELKGCDK
jgi:hypothetical protein